MRILYAIGLIAAVTTPAAIWQIAAFNESRQLMVEVAGPDLVRTSAPPELATRAAGVALAEFCRQRSLIVTDEHSPEIERSARRWQLIDESMKPTAEVARRVVQQSSDARGCQWKIETVGGPGMPTLLFVSGDEAGGPSQLTNLIAETVRKEASEQAVAL